MGTQVVKLSQKMTHNTHVWPQLKDADRDIFAKFYKHIYVSDAPKGDAMSQIHSISVAHEGSSNQPEWVRSKQSIAFTVKFDALIPAGPVHQHW